MRILWLVLGWSMIITYLTLLETICLKKELNFNTAKGIYTSFMINYSSHINFISILIFINILGYVRLKFDQINQNLLDFTKSNKLATKRAWENSISLSHKCKFRKTRNSEWVIWIIIQLHLELRKICHEIDAIFGMGITMSTGGYCCWLAQILREIFRTIFDNNYSTSRMQHILLNFSWFSIFFFKLLLLNVMCESINFKANATGDLINRISYSICDVEIRENISQFLLQIAQAPIRFYGIGLFQFGYKFLYKFFQYIVTVLIILAQNYTNM
ncbi:uncharacterized protein LOC114931997 [Nylanderia fulva]|uniref:uncharacterized protein LOC114931997 n=1 Tax=Nylanderia fulva TaxID=613905 RepID=UPI0010FADD66|nr:uncharacterized protein LOC114931997 [Nylanderia fulva]